METKELSIKDLWLGMRVLHTYQYFGGQVASREIKVPATVYQINLDGIIHAKFTTVLGESDYYSCRIVHITPVLRSWDSMTKDEIRELEDVVTEEGGGIINFEGHTVHIGLTSNGIRWCQDRNIDHNRWIDDGLAIDVETLNQKGDANGE